MWFGLLGAFTVIDDKAEEVELGPPQRRELLALLLSSPNRGVSVDTIVDALWPLRTPGGARASIQSHISRLRKALGPERIVTRSSGYLVRVAADTFDVLDFQHSVEDAQRLASGGSTRTAFDALTRGLSLWRGEPYWDYSYSDWALLEISRLRMMRQTALRQRFDLALSLGLHEQVLTELAIESDLSPGDEALVRLHATALYRSGLQREALGRLARLRSYLLDDLGLDPSPETEDLESAILRHDDVLGHGMTTRIEAEASGPRPDESGSPHDGLDEMEILGDSGSSQFSRSRSSRLTNLPAALTSFIGRTREMEDVEALIRSQRLVTVTGPAGVGKTRLALQVAGGLVDDLVDGVWLAELAAVEDSQLIPVAILHAMGTEQVDANAAASLFDVLEGRQTLLVIDNCEHLIDAVAELVESVLKRASGVKVLATSREPLGIPGEFLHPLTPLHVPDINYVSQWDSLDSGDAMRLFADRARAVAPDLLDLTFGPSVAAICRRLDGLPLALELAAAQLDHLTLDELSLVLDAGLSAMESPYRTVPNRQRTMTAAVEWSYRLITPTEQIVFRRLAAFTGDFDQDAARVVCGSSPLTDDVAPVLNRLVKRSLLARLPEGRFALLQVLRHAAFEQLVRAGEEEATIEAQAGYYLDESTQAIAFTRGPQQVEWIRRLDLDWPNIRTALQWALLREPSRGARAVVGLSDYFRVDHGWEGLEWTSNYLKVIDDENLVLKLHQTRVLSATISSVHDVTIESSHYILDHASEGDDEATADALAALAMKAVENTEPMAAIKARMVGVHSELPRVQRIRANIEAYDRFILGDLEGAAEWTQRALDLVPLTGETWATVGGSANLADIMMRLGRFDEALATVDRAIAAGREVGARVMLAFSLITRAEILYRMGHFDEGLESAVEGLELAHRVSSRFEFTSGAEVTAALLLSLGRIEEAAVLHCLSHARAESWGQEGLLSQFSLYHGDLVEGLESLPSSLLERSRERGVETPLPILIEEIRATLPRPAEAPGVG